MLLRHAVEKAEDVTGRGNGGSGHEQLRHLPGFADRILAGPGRGACGGQVVVGDGYVAARFSAEPILENALFFDPARLSEVQAVYCGVERYAIWTSDAETANAAAEAGFVRDEVTVAMVCPLPLGAWPEPDPPTAVERTDVDTIADLNQVSVGILRGVPGARAYATAEAASGALLIEVGTDVNVSFVATRPDAAPPRSRHRRPAPRADRGQRTTASRAPACRRRRWRCSSIATSGSARWVSGRSGCRPTAGPRVSEAGDRMSRCGSPPGTSIRSAPGCRVCWTGWARPAPTWWPCRRRRRARAASRTSFAVGGLRGGARR